ncbi:MAG TPA: HEAT repeat domain-containing protein, partial [Humisphaera sp.]|nr:HEAT repeat domain-containing protein [Humisphaera sp.]
LRNPPSSIRLLEDTHRVGVFDKATTFADKMVFPQGVAWTDGSLFSASPPSLWRLRDTHGVGVADDRTELVTSFGFTGNAADIHGPVLGPDGYLYWCDGRHGHKIALPNGGLSEGLAARIFRCRPDGSALEVVCGGGMDNPVKVAFTAEGEPLVGVNLIHAKPQRVDGIIYALEGAVFPYHASLGEFPSTGPLFEPVDNLGWVAVAGIVRNRGSALGESYRDNLFSCQFNPHRVQRHVIARDGAGFRISHEDFLTCSHPDFHPTDIIEDADGSLLLINTGGWFRIGCPNSQLAKPDVKGAIYRIRRTDAPRIDDPRGLKLAWQTMKGAELTHFLDDPRPFVQDRAIASLAKLGKESIPYLKDTLRAGTSVEARRNAVWALTRIDRPESLEAICLALTDASSSVRQVAARNVGLRRDAASASQLIEMLRTDSAPIRREAATALGRIKSRESVPALLAALRGNADRFLEHALIYAMIRIDDRFATLQGLKDADPIVQRGALIALDQMYDGGLTPDVVSPYLSNADPVLQSTAARIISKRLEWGGAMEGYFRKSLARADLTDVQREELKQQIATFGRSPAIQALVVEALQSDRTPVGTRVLLLEAISQSPVAKLPDGWQKEISKCLEDADERIARQAIFTAKISPALFASQLLHVAQDAKRGNELRVQALTPVAPTLDPLTPALFDLLLSCLKPAQPILLRSAAADAISHAHLNSAQHEQLIAILPTAGPIEMPGLVQSFEHGGGADVGHQLLIALAASPAFKSLRPELLNQVLHDYPDEIKREAIPLIARLSADVQQQKAHLEELLAGLSGGQSTRGRDLFFSAKAVCSTCHAVGDQGGHVGPDLSKIGAIRTPRDLLESIVYPSASFARGYEPWLVKTKDGDVQSGLISQQTADAIYFITGPRETKRILRSQISDLRLGTVSVMPQGFDAQFSRQELADVVAFLASLR